MLKTGFVLAPLLMAIGGTALAQTPAWRISEVSGQVTIIENGGSRAATRGMLLAQGSTIATAAQARAVVVRGQEFVVVSPRSRLRIPQAQTSGGIVQMLTDWGTALFRIERRSTPHFGVQTPYLAAVVKGTTFTVTVGEAGASVQVTEGAVEVSTLDGGAAELVRPGMIAAVNASDRYQLNIEGDGSRAIRSERAPAPGIVSVPLPASSVPAAPTAIVINAVGEQRVPLSDSTGGLVEETVELSYALGELNDFAPDPQTGQAGGNDRLAGDDVELVIALTGGGRAGLSADSDGEDRSDDEGGLSGDDDEDNGHGNDADGVDEDNPGNGGGGPGSGSGAGGSSGSGSGAGGSNGSGSGGGSGGGGGGSGGPGSGGDSGGSGSGGGSSGPPSDPPAEQPPVGNPPVEEPSVVEEPPVAVEPPVEDPPADGGGSGGLCLIMICIGGDD